MKQYCGNVIYPEEIRLDADMTFKSFVYDGYDFYPWMYEKVYQKEGDKLESMFTKNDLRDGMIVEYRNGKMRLVIGNQLLGLDKGEWNDLSTYHEDLNNTVSSDFTIDRVYVKNKDVIDIKLLFCIDYLKLIWKREVKEISVSEAMKILREKFDCEVKIVNDK